MTKIFFYLLLLCSINFYGNDTITAVSIKNINLRENATADSKVITEIKADDTLIITETENGWSKSIYKDSLNGFVKSEYVKEISSKKETLKLTLFKSYFLSALLFISALCFGFLYILKSKLVQLDITGNFSLLIKSFLIGFIFTIIGTLYFFYDLFSFFNFFGIIILLLFLVRTISKVFKYENEIKIIKSSFSENENLRMITIEYLENEILNQKKKIDEIKLNKEDIMYKMDVLKNEANLFLKDLTNELESHISDEFGEESLNNLIQNKIPIIGMPKELVHIYFGFPEKIIRDEKENHIKEKLRYGFIKTYYNKDYYKTDITLLNGIVESFITN